MFVSRISQNICFSVCLFIAVAFGFVTGSAKQVFGEGSNLGFRSGGKFSDYDPIVYQYNASGERFRIRGRCRSACTMFLGIRNVCVEPTAVFQFHAGSVELGGTRVQSAISSAHMMAHYNSRLRTYLEAGKYLETRDLHNITGRDMIAKFGYPACPPR